MIKAVQSSLCAFAKVGSDERTRSPQSVQSSAEDDDCVYVSPDEAEKGISSILTLINIRGLPPFTMVNLTVSLVLQHPLSSIRMRRAAKRIQH